jgi:hypothetical protein
VCALAVCARRTTLKSGFLHFADEGAIIISNGVVAGRLCCCTCRWYDWLPMSSLHVYLLTMAMYVFDGVPVWDAGHLWGAGLEGVHMGRKLVMRMREPVDRRGDEHKK